MLRLEGVSVNFTGNKGEETSCNLLRGCVPINICNTKSPALLDSGASVCVVKQSFLSSLNVPRHFKCIPCKIDMYLADGSVTTAKSRIVLPFLIHDKLYRIEFKVLEKMSRPIILGVDFLEKYRAQFNYFPGNKEVSPIRAISSLILPAMTEVTLQAKVISHSIYDPDWDVGLCENLDRGENREIPFLVKKTLVTPNEHKKITLSLLNCTNHRRTIKRGQILGLYVPQQKESMLALDATLPLPSDVNPPGTECLPSSPSTWPQPPAPAAGGDHGVTVGGATPQRQPEEAVHSLLSPAEQAILEKLLAQYEDVFVGPDGQLGLTNLVKHRIELTPDAVPISQMPYRQSPLKREAMKQAIAKQLRQNIIEPTSTGDWSSPAFLVKKSSGDFRVVVDYRHVNGFTKPQYTNIPRIDDTLDSLGEAKPKVFSTLDLESGFHQVPIDERDRDATAFLTSEGRFRYKVLSMGQKNSPRCFQALMDMVLNKVAFKHSVCYMDDIVVYSPDVPTHFRDLAEVFDLLRAANLKLKRSKCTFGLDQIKYLGFIISAHGISPCPSKVAAIRDFPVPKTVKDVRSFCGLAQFYRKFIQNFSGIARPMFDLLKDKTPFIWSPECDKAFQSLKTSLTSSDILMYPDFSKPFVLATDASDVSVGATLQQYDDKGNLKPIAYAGRALKPAEKNYSVTHRELLGVVWAVEYFRVYLESDKFLILTDHSALTFLMKQKHANQRLIRWQIVLNGLDFEIQHIKGKLNVVPDALSRRDYPETETEADKRFNDTSDLAAIQTADSAPCPSPPALPSPTRQSAAPQSPLQLQALTRSRTKMQAPAHPPPPRPTSTPPANATGSPARQTHDPGPQGPITARPTTHCPPSLPSRISGTETSIEGEGSSKSSSKSSSSIGGEKGGPKATQTKEGSLPTVDIGGGTKNEKSDNINTEQENSQNTIPPPHTGKMTQREKRLKRLAQARENVRHQMHLLKREVSIDLSPKALAKQQSEDEECSMIRDFLKDRKIPGEGHLKRWMLLNQDKFMLHDNILYEISEKNRTGEMVIRIVLPENMQLASIQMFHDHSLAAHKGLANTLEQVRQRFWWYGLVSDVQRYVATCHKCISTRVGGKTIRPPMTLRDITPAPFSSICIDTLSLTPTPRGYKYVHVVVDFCTRFVVAWPARSNSTAELASGFNDFYLSRFGAPKSIQSDNGSTFISDLFKNLCAIWGVNQKFSSAFLSRSNGAVERANRTILTRVRTLISKSQTEWDLILQNVTYAINSAPAFATNHSPFLLAYGWTPLHPYDVQRPIPDKAPQCVRDQFLERITLQAKAMEMAVKHTAVTRERMKSAYDKKAHMVYFYEGDCVYLHIPRLILKETRKKLTPMYHGPFTIMSLTTPYTAILRRHYDCKVLKRSVHISRLKKAEVRNLADFQKNVIYRESDLPCTLAMCAKPAPLANLKDKKPLASKVRKTSSKRGKANKPCTKISNVPKTSK